MNVGYLEKFICRPNVYWNEFHFEETFLVHDVNGKDSNAQEMHHV